MTTLAANSRTFLLRRLHSLTGIIPIGGFLLFHFFENASARRGAEAFNATVVKISEMPYLYLSEIFLLALPILFHGIYGIFIGASSKPNLYYANSRSIAYVFQRITGIIAFFYILFHVLSTRIWSLFVKGEHITYFDMQQQLANPFVFLFYSLGILSICFHFCNGLWSFSITWGLVVSEKGQQQLARLTFVAFAGLSLIGLDILSAFVVDGGFLGAIVNGLIG